MCAAIPALDPSNPTWQAELDAYRQMAINGDPWFDFDHEHPPDAFDCHGALADFAALHPSYPSLSGIRWNKNDGHLIHNLQDRDLDQYQADFAQETWTQMREAMFEGLVQSGRSDEPIVMSNWKTFPGYLHPNHDFDQLYPQVFTHAMPGIYPDYHVPNQAAGGEKVRQAVLGTFALANENLVANPSLEMSTPAWTFGPITWTDPVSSSVPVGFAYYGAASWQEITADPQSSWAAHGLHSVRLEPGAQLMTDQTLLIEPGESYVAAASVVRDGTVDGCVTLQWLGGAGQVLSQSDPGCGPTRRHEFFRVSTWSTAPVNAVQARVSVWATSGDGFVIVDKVMLVTPDRIENGSFEIGDPSSAYQIDQHKAWTWETGPAANGDRSACWQPTGKSSKAVALSQTTPVEPGVAFQLSAMAARSHRYDATGMLALNWIDSRGNRTGDQVSTSAPQGAHLQSVVISGVAPPNAVQAHISFEAWAVPGEWSCVDDLELRVDGPYAVPWYTGGYMGLHQDDWRFMTETVLESYLAGAQGLTNYPSNSFYADDFEGLTVANAMLDEYEDIIMDGQPIPADSLYVDGAERIIGMRLHGLSLVLISDYSDSFAQFKAEYVTGGATTVSEVDLGGSPIPQSSSYSGAVISGVIDPSDTARPRARLFLVEHL